MCLVRFFLVFPNHQCIPVKSYPSANFRNERAKSLSLFFRLSGTWSTFPQHPIARVVENLKKMSWDTKPTMMDEIYSWWMPSRLTQDHVRSRIVRAGWALLLLSCSWSVAALLGRPRHQLFHFAPDCCSKTKHNTKSEWKINATSSSSLIFGGNPWAFSDVYFITSNKHVNYQDESITQLISIWYFEMPVMGRVVGEKKKITKALLDRCCILEHLPLVMCLQDFKFTNWNKKLKKNSWCWNRDNWRAVLEGRKWRKLCFELKFIWFCPWKTQIEGANISSFRRRITRIEQKWQSVRERTFSILRSKQVTDGLSFWLGLSW